MLNIFNFKAALSTSPFNTLFCFQSNHTSDLRKKKCYFVSMKTISETVQDCILLNTTGSHFRIIHNNLRQCSTLLTNQISVTNNNIAAMETIKVFLYSNFLHMNVNPKQFRRTWQIHSIQVLACVKLYQRCSQLFFSHFSNHALCRAIHSFPKLSNCLTPL